MACKNLSYYLNYAVMIDVAPLTEIKRLGLAQSLQGDRHTAKGYEHHPMRFEPHYALKQDYLIMRVHSLWNVAMTRFVCRRIVSELAEQPLDTHVALVPVTAIKR